jgi:subtilisin-like proprotein convertase family protein
MKITNKTLMVSFETEVKLGNNDAIELTLIHQAFISKNKEGGIDIDLELGIDVDNIKFLGIELESPTFKSFKKLKEQLLEMGIDVNNLLFEKEKELRDSGIEDKLKLMFKDKF